MQGALDEAERRGISLVIVAGGILSGRGRNGTHRNFLFELVSRQGFDGAIVMSGTLGNELGIESVEELAGELGDLALCSVASPLGGHPWVRADNAAGMRAAVEHLVVSHGHRRIAFIRGPAVNQEAESRYQAYRDVLTAQGIDFDPNLVLPGNFQRSGGHRAVVSLLDERGVRVEDLDAIACATDLTAMGALDALAERKIRVPAEVALVGFDDLEEARYFSPPLASVRQPLAAQGAEALRQVLGQLGTASSSETRVLSTLFVPRRSCGCLPHEETEGLVRPFLASNLSLEANLIRQRDVLLAEMSRAVRGELHGVERGWEVRLFRALQEELRNERPLGKEPFKDELDEILVATLEAGGDVSIGHALVSALRRNLWQVAGDDPSKLRRVEDVMHGGRLVISALLERSQARARLASDSWARQIARASGRLASAASPDDLRRRLIEVLPELGIRLCLIFRFVDGKRTKARLFCGWAADPLREGLLAVAPEFEVRELVPAQVISREEATRLVALPISSDGRRFGYVVFDCASVPSYTFEVLRELLSGVLLNVLDRSAEG
jgi:DNA-binding LacI/PurR family transcriptional regulator